VGNNASDNDCGIYLLTLERYHSNGSSNSIHLHPSHNNTLFVNNLIDNKRDNAIDAGTNQWDDGATGNYYSDFNCTDSDGDGICDSVYKIPGGESVDRYPLAKPST